MNKGTYIYKPSTRYYWTNHQLDSMDSFLKANDGKYGNGLREFFATPKVQELVDNQEWQELFKAWFEYDDYYGADVLGSFLWLLEIDFMEYLEDNYVKNHFSVYNYVNRTTGKGLLF